jgi:2-polyprenyl-6-methoxyphenol hydroxylase-like FAD-dependent oxidoreductase
VALIERARFPRDKPCGEGLLPTGVAVLTSLGLGTMLGTLGAPPLHALAFVLDGVAVRAALPGSGAGVERVRFDALLAAAAREAGVRWFEGRPEALRRDGDGRVCGLRLEDGRRVEAAVVVGADGLRSWTRTQLGLTTARATAPRYGLCARVELPRAAGEHVEVHVVPGVGELYLTPSGGRQLSLALLASRASMSRLRGRLEAATAAAIARSPALGRRLADARLLGRAQATGPLATRARRPWGSGALLAGDAALAIDPIGGDGITLALTGSEACARAVQALLAGAPEASVGREYARALQADSRRRRAFVNGLLALATHPRLARPALSGLARAPWLLRVLCAAHEGADLRGLLRAAR